MREQTDLTAKARIIFNEQIKEEIEDKLPIDTELVASVIM